MLFNDDVNWISKISELISMEHWWNDPEKEKK